MTAVPFVVLLVIFAGTKIAPKGTYNDNYLSLKNTNALRGMCALIVAMQHTCAYQHDKWTAPFFVYRIFMHKHFLLFVRLRTYVRS